MFELKRLELDNAVAGALLRFQMEKGFATANGAVAHIIIHFLASKGYL